MTDPHMEEERHLKTEIAAHFDLPQQIDAFSPLPSINNRCYRVETASARWIFKIYRTWPQARVAAELAVMAHLRAAGLPVAAPMRTKDGADLLTFGGRPACLLSWLPGQTLARPLSPENGRWLGEVLGQVHQALSTLPAEQPLPREPLPALTELRQRWIDWRERVHACPDDPMAPAFRAWIDLLLAEAERIDLFGIDWPSLGWQPLHGDFHAGNVLQQAGRLSGLLDLEHSRAGPRLIDIAYACCSTLNDLQEAPEERLERLWQFVAGYHAYNPLRPQELALVPAAILLDRLADFHVLERHFDEGDRSLDRFLASDTALLTWLQTYGPALVKALKPLHG